MYEIMKKLFELLEDLFGEIILEDEIVYVIILFGGYFLCKNNILVEWKKFLIVCFKGVGMLWMIEW